MARLHEYQGKALLAEQGIAIPTGIVIERPAQAAEFVRQLDAPVILKVQAWVTGRRDKGGVVLADSPEQAQLAAKALLGMTFGNFPVTQVLVEEQIAIRDELFVSLTIDDAAQAPLLLLDCRGGSGIEDRAQTVVRIPVTPDASIDPALVAAALAASPIDGALHDEIVDAIERIVALAKTVEARALEVNPLVTTQDGRVVAADCRMTIDDYAVFRHPELGIEIARELDHPATNLERIAYDVEQADHRGTFYFAQLPTDEPSFASPQDDDPTTTAGKDGHVVGESVAEPAPGTGANSHTPNQPPAHGRGAKAGLIGFHGAGGGGSMMSMDAVTNTGFAIANFCDTSGNPSASKVYRAARIILSQPGLIGYFGSGSGVASQEQFWSAYGLAKAFNEVKLDIPAVIRLGGNSEDRAVEILQDACAQLPGTVEGYKKDDTPQFVAERFAALVEAARTDWRNSDSLPTVRGSDAGGEGENCKADPGGTAAPPVYAHPRHIPDFVNDASAYSFEIEGGSVWIDTLACDDATAQRVVDLSDGILQLDTAGKPQLAAAPDDIVKRDSEFIMLEVECARMGTPVVFVDLPIAGIDTPRQAVVAAQ